MNKELFDPPAIVKPAGALQVLAERINAEHAEALSAARASLIHARKAGQLLLEAKKQCGHGDWLPWLTANVKVSERTAQAYMRVAKRWPELEAKAQATADLSIEDGLKLLAPPKDAASHADMELCEVPIDSILIPARRARPYRREGMGSLTKSIKWAGLINPISLRRSGGDFVLIAGLRRLRAMKWLGRTTITAIVFNLDSREARLLEISENLDREPLTALEIAEHQVNYGRIIERLRTGSAKSEDRRDLLRISENLHRLELTALERAEHQAECNELRQKA
jgi:hypothetical protein